MQFVAGLVLWVVVRGWDQKMNFCLNRGAGAVGVLFGITAVIIAVAVAVADRAGGGEVTAFAADISARGGERYTYGPMDPNDLQRCAASNHRGASRPWHRVAPLRKKHWAGLPQLGNATPPPVQASF